MFLSGNSNLYLVGALEHEFYDFPFSSHSVGNVIIPTDEVHDFSIRNPGPSAVAQPSPGGLSNEAEDLELLGKRDPLLGHSEL